VHGQGELAEVVATFNPPGSLAGGLNGRQEQRDQHADDRDHDQQLHEGKTV
jgi:hypothetical protein